MYYVKYCFAAAFECQPSSFFGHTNPAHIVTSCDKSGPGCRQTEDIIVLTIFPIMKMNDKMSSDCEFQYFNCLCNVAPSY